MAHAFQIIPAKPAFGTIRQNMYQSDYIKRKNAISTFINKKSANKNYDTKYLLNKGKYYFRINNCDVLPINKSNLIAGQYTKMNLEDVCSISAFDASQNDCETICHPVSLNKEVVFYENYVIDPCGQLFGRNQCGKLNYSHYMVYRPHGNNEYI